MRKIVLFAAAVVAMASCTQKIEPVNAGRSDQRIMFETPVVGMATKASDYAGVISGTTFPTNENFKVYAVKHSGAFSAWSAATAYFGENGADFDYDSAAHGWVSNPAFYWPKGDDSRLSFQAYSPADLTATTITVNETGLNLTGYTVATGLKAQNDILFSSRVTDKTANDGTYGTDLYGVQLSFHHALAQVAFDAKLKTGTVLGESESITITSIVLKNVNTKGDFAQTLVDNSVTGTKGTPTWSNQNTPSNYANIVAASATQLPAANASAEDVTTHATTNYTPILVLPSKFVADDPGTAAVNEASYLEITYTTVLGGVTETDIVATVNLNALTYDSTAGTDARFKGFEPGKRYLYHITIGLDKVYFAPSVEDWDNVTITGGIDI